MCSAEFSNLLACFYKIIHISVHFSAIVNRFIVKAKLNSNITNDLKRKDFFSENVHKCRLSHFKPTLQTIWANQTNTKGSVCPGFIVFAKSKKTDCVI